MNDSIESINYQNHRVRYEIKIQANNDLMQEGIMVFSLHNRTYTVQRSTGCKLSRRSGMQDSRYTDKKMYYYINTDKTIIISLQITQAKVKVLVSEILILRVANILFCRYLILNFITGEKKLKESKWFYLTEAVQSLPG